MKPSETPRERDTKRYTYSLDRACKCGHRLGEHSADKNRGEQPCLEDGCDCILFKPAK